MLLVDANILTYLLIESESSGRARALLQMDSVWHGERFILVELTNVLTTHVRAGIIRIHEADLAMDRIEALMGNNLHNAEHKHVIRIADEFRISAYDGRYIALAREMGTPLITEDVKLRRAVPGLTVSLDEALHT